jgi:hypothetical protein
MGQEQGNSAGGERSDQENRAGDPGHPQCHGLADGLDTEHIDAGVEQHLGGLAQPVAVCVAFHHREELTARPNDLTAGIYIGEKRGTIDLNPGIGCDHRGCSGSSSKPLALDRWSCIATHCN